MSLPEMLAARPSVERCKTRRMTAERLRPIHYPEVRRLHLSPQIFKTLSAEGQVLPDHVTKDGLLQNETHWERYGFGLWLFRSRADGQFLGRGGLQYYEIDGRFLPGLLYSVILEHWNQGLATEMAELSLEIGFTRFQFPKIASWTLASNIASQRVMEKVGFRYDTDIVFAGMPHRLYLISSLHWQMGRGT